MRKKMIAMLTAAAMLAMAPAVPSAAEEDPYNIIMQIPIFGTDMPALEEVETAINEIILPEINATVTLMPVSVPSMATESSMMISSGEKLDLMCILPYGAGLDSINNYSSKNMLTPLNDLFDEYGADMKESLGNMISLGYSGDTLYAIPSRISYGGYHVFGMRKDMVDQMDIEIDEERIYTVEELEELLDAFKEQFGDGYYAIASFGSTSTQFSNLYNIDTLGTDSSDGVLMSVDENAELKVENLFATDAYEEYVKRMYEWNQKGYFNPDVTTITDDITSLMATGMYFGCFGTRYAVNSKVMEERIGTDMVNISLCEPYATGGEATSAIWAIPVTSENPEKTMEFLNLLYQKRDLEKSISTLLYYGTEGTCYQVLEKLENSRAIIDYPEGVNGATVPWVAAGPIYGDQLELPLLAPLTKEAYEDYETFDEELHASGRISRAFGYVFNPETVSVQKASVQSVLSQYLALLEYGQVDPEQGLPEFRQALEDAGIEDLIAENQRQLDEWAAKNNE